MKHLSLLLVTIFSLSAHTKPTQEKIIQDVASEKNQLELASTFLNAGLPFAALKSLEKIINAGKTHSQYTKAIDMLSTMSKSDAAELLVSQLLVSVYEKDPNAFASLSPEKKQNVHYAVANRLFRIGKGSEARPLAASIQATHPLYIKAQYLLALDAMKLKSANDIAKDYSGAITHFEAIRKNVSESTQEPESFNIRNLATLGIARAYYEQAYALADDDANRKTLTNKALEEYRSIPRFSEAWGHAIFEMGWAYTILEEYGDALGAVRSLTQPYFAKAYYPEAEILSAIVYWYNCQWDRANRALKNWNDKYLPISKALKDASAAKKTNKNWEDLSDLPPQIAEEIKNDPQYRIFSSLTASLQSEREKLNSNSELKNAPNAKLLNEYYVRAAADLKKGANTWMEQRLSRLIDDLEDMKTRASIISLETKTAETQWLEEGRQISGIKRAKLARPYVPVDRNQFWWVNNTESWKDELGYYRLSIKSECYE